MSPAFDLKRPYFGWLVLPNRGHSDSPVIYRVHYFVESRSRKAVIEVSKEKPMEMLQRRFCGHGTLHVG